MADYPWSNPHGAPPPASYAFQTRVKALSALKYWLNHRYDVESGTVVQKLAYGEEKPFDPTILPPNEIQSIVTDADMVCSNDDCRMMIRLGYDAIMRGVEITRVRREDVDLSNQSVFVRAAKGSNAIHLGLSDDVWYELQTFCERHPDRDYLFSNAHGNRLHPDTWSEHFRNAHHGAGWHAVGRHSAITNRLRDGEDFGSVFQRARHQNPSMTLRYARIVDADVPDWVEE